MSDGRLIDIGEKIRQGTRIYASDGRYSLEVSDIGDLLIYDKDYIVWRASKTAGWITPTSSDYSLAVIEWGYTYNYYVQERTYALALIDGSGKSHCTLQVTGDEYNKGYPPYYFNGGQIYWIRRGGWKDYVAGYGSGYEVGGNYGVDIFSGSGRLAYSSTSVTWNQVDTMYVKGGGFVKRSFDEIKGKEVLVTQMLIKPPPLDRKAIAHTIRVDGDTVTVSGGSEDAFVLVLMR